MNPYAIILVAIISYLAGSIPVSRMISKLVGHGEELEEQEIRVEGTDESFKITAMGAATASMKHGSKVGCTIGLLDILKVALPTLVFKLIYPDQSYLLIAGVAGMAGHNWPIFNRFHGGRGISSAYGSLLVVDPIGAIACALGGLILGLFVFREYILAYFSGLWLMVPWLWFRTHDPSYLYYALAINLLFILAMIPDLRQYLKFRKMGKINMTAAMEINPMGRGMRRIMERFHLISK